MEKHSSMKPPTPGLVPSKTVITLWLKSLFPDLPLATKIQDFGDGVIYCRLLNHYYGNPPHSKITWSPKNQYQYINNLKHAQTALLQLSITIPFDVNRVCKRKFLENWALINAFYKHFLGEELPVHEQNTTATHTNPGHHAGTIHHQPPNASLIQLNHTPKNTKRFHGTHAYNLQLQKSILPPRFSGHNINIQQPFWDQSIPLSFASLAHSSLQISQLLKQNVNLGNNTNNRDTSPTKGKWSVGAQAFQNNYHAVIDRVKEILLKASHDTQKVRQIKMLLGMSLQQQQVIKIQDDDGIGHVIYNQSQPKTEQKTLIKHAEENKPKPVQVLLKLEQKRIEAKDQKQAYDMVHKQASNNSFRQNKCSMSKSAKKPFKI